MRSVILIGCLFGIFFSNAQEHGFEFGKITYAELDMKTYEFDTSAVAVVLREFGDAYFDLDKLNTIYLHYHVKIKILKEEGKRFADFEIPLRKNDTRQEIVRNLKATSFNRENNTWKETPLQMKDVFNENFDKEWGATKFAVPNVRVGSVIEVYYQLEIPFTYNFVPWQFQSDIPKVKSEFWAKYPAYYDYYIALKGFLPLTTNEVEVIKNCVGSNVSDFNGAGGADCTQYKYGMENIPAFRDEPYMTAKRNFLSSIRFELRQVTQKDGTVDRITNEWKDAERELKEDLLFGMQIKKARNLYEEKATLMKAAQPDQLLLVKEIHDYFKSTFTWNGDFGYTTDKGVKKAQDESRGNVADINLSMLGALLAADIYAEPVLLATRARGLPTKLYPVLSEFNYVIIRVKVGDKYYFLDATSPLYPVGFIPERCLNGQGRAVGDTKAWIDLKPNEKERTVTDFKLKMTDAGTISGTVAVNSYGYAAIARRIDFFEKSNLDEYVKERTDTWRGVETKNFKVENERDITKPFIEKFDLSVEELGGSTDVIYFPLFVYQQNDKNPFTSNERYYPVDFGAPVEYIYLLNFEFPPLFEPEDLPQNVALTLPNAGGRFLLNVNKQPGKLSVSCSLSLTRSVYNSEEYHALREIYTRYISVLQSMIVLKKAK